MKYKAIGTKYYGFIFVLISQHADGTSVAQCYVSIVYSLFCSAVFLVIFL